MPPEVLTQPRPAGHPDAVIGVIYGCCAAPEVGIMVKHPPAAVVVHFCGLSSGDNEVFEHIEQRFVTLREVAYFGRPVVHLRVDVDRILAAPGRRDGFVPDPL